MFASTRCFWGWSQPFCHCEWEGMQYVSDHWVWRSTFHIIYLKTGWWSLLKYGFIIFTNMLHYDKFIYCNIMVKLRHVLLFSYYPHHRVLSLLSIISGASFHTRVRSQEPFQCRCLRIFFVFRKREAHKGRWLYYSLGCSHCCLPCIWSWVSKKTVPNPQLPRDTDFWYAQSVFSFYERKGKGSRISTPSHLMACQISHQN